MHWVVDTANLIDDVWSVSEVLFYPWIADTSKAYITMRFDYDTITTTKNWHVHFFARVESRRMEAGGRDMS